MRRIRPLRAFRDALEITRDDLARAVGRGSSTLEKYEADLPDDLIRDLEAYARGRGREDAISLLRDDGSRTPATPILERAVELWLTLGVDGETVLAMLNDPDHRETKLLLQSIKTWKNEQLKLKKREVPDEPKSKTTGARGVHERRGDAA